MRSTIHENKYTHTQRKNEIYKFHDSVQKKYFDNGNGIRSRFFFLRGICNLLYAIGWFCISLSNEISYRFQHFYFMQWPLLYGTTVAVANTPSWLRYCTILSLINISTQINEKKKQQLSGSDSFIFLHMMAMECRLFCTIFKILAKAVRCKCAREKICSNH